MPLWVLEAWVSGDADGAAVAWLDDLFDRDRGRWDVAFVELISTPAFTPGA